MGKYLETARQAVRKMEEERAMKQQPVKERLAVDLVTNDGTRERCFACGQSFTTTESQAWLFRVDEDDVHEERIGVLCPACVVEGPQAVKKYLLEQVDELRRLAKLAGEVEQDGWMSPTLLRRLVNGHRRVSGPSDPDELPF